VPHLPTGRGMSDLALIILPNSCAKRGSDDQIQHHSREAISSAGLRFSHTGNNTPLVACPKGASMAMFRLNRGSAVDPPMNSPRGRFAQTLFSSGNRHTLRPGRHANSAQAKPVTLRLYQKCQSNIWRSTARKQSAVGEIQPHFVADVVSGEEVARCFFQ
jgi:hypothetical protein